MTDNEQIWEAVCELNRARWGDGDGALTAFDEEGVMVALGPPVRQVGAFEAARGTRLHHTRWAKDFNFRVLDHSVEVLGDVAVVLYRFVLRYHEPGGIFDETGLEVLVFVRRGDRWAATWRTQESLARTHPKAS